MAGLQSRVQLVSNALLLLGGQPISSLTDGSTGALLGANLFENTYLEMLSSHRWRFAVKSLKLSKLTQSPDTDFNYAFQLPADLVYLIKADVANYEVYEKELHSNANDVTIDYTYRVEEDTLPAYFAKALEYNLAAQFAVPLTGDMSKGQYYNQAFLNAVKKAKFADSTQRPGDAFVSSPYTDVRY